MSGVKGKSGVYKRTKYHKQKIRESENRGRFKKGHKTWNKGKINV